MSYQSHSDDDGHEHLTPLPVYFAIFGALMVLTVLTVLVSYMGLGKASIFVAMAVAIVKAALVAGYFMHLKWDDPFNRLLFAGSIVFMGIFFVLTAMDIGFRGRINPETANGLIQSEEHSLATEAARHAAYETQGLALQRAPGSVPNGEEHTTPVTAPPPVAAPAPAAAPAAPAAAPAAP